MSYTPGTAHVPCPPPSGPVQGPQVPIQLPLGHCCPPTHPPLPSLPGSAGLTAWLLLRPCGHTPAGLTGPPQPQATDPRGRPLPTVCDHSCLEPSASGSLWSCRCLQRGVCPPRGPGTPLSLHPWATTPPRLHPHTTPRPLASAMLGTPAPHNTTSKARGSLLPISLNNSPLPEGAHPGPEQRAGEHVQGRGRHAGRSQAGPEQVGRPGSSHLHSAGCQHCHCHS